MVRRLPLGVDSATMSSVLGPALVRERDCQIAKVPTITRMAAERGSRRLPIGRLEARPGGVGVLRSCARRRKIGAHQIEGLRPRGVGRRAGMQGGDLVGGGFAGEVSVDQLPVAGVGHEAWPGVVIKYDNRARENPTGDSGEIRSYLSLIAMRRAESRVSDGRRLG